MTTENAREQIARIIDPIAFKAGEALYDYCLKNGDDDATARRYADDTHGPDQRDALVKADAILAALASLPSAVPEAGDAPVIVHNELQAVDELTKLAWKCGHDCEVDDLHSMAAQGDSYNEGQRHSVGKAAAAVKVSIERLAQRLESMTASRDRTRAALEKMREERDAALSPSEGAMPASGEEAAFRHGWAAKERDVRDRLSDYDVDEAWDEYQAGGAA